MNFIKLGGRRGSMNGQLEKPKGASTNWIKRTLHKLASPGDDAPQQDFKKTQTKRLRNVALFWHDDDKMLANTFSNSIFEAVDHCIQYLAWADTPGRRGRTRGAGSRTHVLLCMARGRHVTVSGHRAIYHDATSLLERGSAYLVGGLSPPCSYT